MALTLVNASRLGSSKDASENIGLMETEVSRGGVEEECEAGVLGAARWSPFCSGDGGGTGQAQDRLRRLATSA